jgi:hypothetical protein
VIRWYSGRSREDRAASRAERRREAVARMVVVVVVVVMKTGTMVTRG